MLNKAEQKANEFCEDLLLLRQSATVCYILEMYFFIRGSVFSSVKYRIRNRINEYFVYGFLITC